MSAHAHEREIAREPENSREWQERLDAAIRAIGNRFHPRDRLLSLDAELRDNNGWHLKGRCEYFENWLVNLRAENARWEEDLKRYHPQPHPPRKNRLCRLFDWFNS